MTKDIRNKELSEIINNSTSGSTEILLLLNNYVSENIKSFSEFDKIAPFIREKLNCFSAVNSYLNTITSFRDKNDLDGFLAYTKKLESDELNKFERLFNNTKPFLREINTIITLSNSTTLLEVFRRWKSEAAPNPIKIIIAESRPEEEGKIFAKKLLELGIKCELITDSSMGLFVNMADAAFIGADQVLKSGDIINKTGSCLLALAAKYYGKPYYVLTTKDKFNDSSTYIPEQHSPDEIWKFNHPELLITNYYFETVKRDLITKLITD